MTPESSRIITCSWLTVTPAGTGSVTDDGCAGEAVGDLRHRVVV